MIVKGLIASTFTCFGLLLAQAQSVVFLTVAAVLINGVLVLLPPVFIYALVKYPAFATWVRRLLEDGDDVPNKADAKDAVILFFAYVIGWGLVNLIIYSALFDKEITWLITTTAVLFVALLGVSQVSNLMKK